MNLELAVHSDHLTVTIVNSSTQELRLWEWHNSWGWYSLAIQVRGEADRQIEIKRKSRDWTKNGPVYFIMLPQEKREVLIDLRDGWWEMAEANSASLALASWQNRPVGVRARLQIEPTPESDQFGVFTGAVFSGWITSRPPHGWLPILG